MDEDSVEGVTQKRRKKQSVDQPRKKHQEDDDEPDRTIIRIPPCYYIHVIDRTNNVTKVHVGPQTYIRKENEKVVRGPEEMIVVPNRYYCCIENPVQLDEDGKVLFETSGQAKLSYGQQEIRLYRDPFPLYPGEIMKVEVTKLTLVKKNTALLLCALEDVRDGNVDRVAGDEWLFEGPGKYIPNVSVAVVKTIEAISIQPNTALRLRAKHDFTDRDGNSRYVDEEWLVRKVGSYLPGAYEEVVSVVHAYILTDKEGIFVRAERNFVDQFGIKRRCGDEWLMDISKTESYIPDVNETVFSKVERVILGRDQYCIIENPMDESLKIQLGSKKLIRGEASFFLHPGEVCMALKYAKILKVDEGLLLLATKEFLDTSVDPPIKRSAGDYWMVKGPIEYFPSDPYIEIVEAVSAIPLDDSEGIYVRDLRTGVVKIITGQTYLLGPGEKLWEKELPEEVEALISSKKDPLSSRGVRDTASAEPREKHKLVTYRVPHNTAVQVYDYTAKRSRVVFGPDLVMLHPNEQFTLLSLSGGKPKKPHMIKAIGLLLGPDFCTDIITVETADHARLSIQLAYNWHFKVEAHDEATGAKLFSVPDFIGDMCKMIASKIRGAVANCPFDNFHKNSSALIRKAAFGDDDKLFSEVNMLTITSVDIQNVEPVDQKTRDSLQKSVQLAIEITTKSQEAFAKQEAERLEQEAAGRLERQRIHDEAEAEKAKIELLKLQAEAQAIEACGQAKADARSKAEAEEIEGKSAVDLSKLRAVANKTDSESELERLMQARRSELQYVAEMNKLEVDKANQMAQIDINKFQSMMTSLGTDTLKSISTSGLEYQVRLLEGLGLKSTLITDGRNPINLLQTAQSFMSSEILK